MRYSLAPLALAALAAANPVPQGVTSAISPSSTAGPDCQSSYDGTFNIQVVNVTSSSKRSFQKRQDSALTLTLEDGTLTDSQGRVGYIAANRQFQFDGPPQTGAIYTAGWAVCSNSTLVLGAQAEFQQCLSGDFYNLYDESTGNQCNPIYIDVINGGGSESTQGDGQVTGTAAAPVSQITDGQPQASTSAAPVTQISDGQIQASTSGAPVTQISDGQIQASTSAAPVTQISDGQIQAPTSTGAPVTQISDGQIQAPTSTGAPVTQISDGQIQAPTTTGAPVTQISDGQIQAPTSSGSPVTQISDGQIQAPTNGTIASPSATIQPYTGAAAIPTLRSELFGLAAAGIMAVAML